MGGVICISEAIYTSPTQSLLRFMSIEWVMLSNHLILCCPLLLLPSILPIIRVFSYESALCIGWLKYWSLEKPQTTLEYVVHASLAP